MTTTKPHTNARPVQGHSSKVDRDLDWIDLLPCEHSRDYSIHYRRENGCIHIDSHVKDPRGERTYEKDEFNPYQNFLYKRALYGLTIYTDDEIKVMRLNKRWKIEDRSRRAQDSISLYKQTAMNRIINRTFKKLFPNVKLVNKFVKYTPEPDLAFICKLSFTDLGITKRMVVGILIEQNVLPHNFFELTLADDNRLIRLKPKKVKPEEVKLETANLE